MLRHGGNGTGACGFNEAGVSMTATVLKRLAWQDFESRPLVKDGLPEASMIDLVLPSCKTCSEKESKSLPRLGWKRFCWREYIVVADVMSSGTWKSSSGHQYGLLNSHKTAKMLFLPIPTIWDMSISRTRTVSLLQKREARPRKPIIAKTDKGMANLYCDSYGPDEYKVERQPLTDSMQGITLMIQGRCQIWWSTLLICFVNQRILLNRSIV